MPRPYGIKMVYDPEKHHRRSIRLPEFDYSQPGAYFVTMVAWCRVCLFGEISNSEMRMNALGEIAADCWRAIPMHFPNIELDAMIVMPNHVHGIIFIPVGATHASPLQQTSQSQFILSHGPKPQTIGTIIGSYKSAVTRQINKTRKTPGEPVWQRNYYEHVIRDENEWNRIREYIAINPVRWADDSENPNNPCKGEQPFAPTQNGK